MEAVAFDALNSGDRIRIRLKEGIGGISTFRGKFQGFFPRIVNTKKIWAIEIRSGAETVQFSTKNIRSIEKDI